MIVSENTKMLKTSQKLLIAAWCIEAVAASVGLFFAISRLIPSLQGSAVSSIIGFQGALPFFAVAIIELTKIPLAYVCYQTTQFAWKLVFGLSLFAAMFITFETFFMGFESYQSILTKELRPTLDKIKDLRRIEDTSQNTITSASKIRESQVSEDQRHALAIDEINQKFKTNTLPIEKKIQDINDKYAMKSQPLQSELNRKKADETAEKASFKKESERLETNRQTELDTGTKNFDNNLKSNRDNLTRAEMDLKELDKNQQKQLVDLKVRHDQKFAASTIFSSNGVKISNKEELDQVEKKNADIRNAQVKNIENLRKRVNSSTSFRDDINRVFDAKMQNLTTQHSRKVKDIREQIRSLEDKISKSLSSDKTPGDERNLKELSDKIKSEDEEKIRLLKEEADNFKTKTDMFNDQLGRVSDASQDIENAQNDLEEPCSKLNEEVLENQVYRLSMQVFSVEDACELTEKQLSIIKAIWFGSLALIVSGLGTMLAFAAFVISDEAVNTKRRLGYLSKRTRLVFVAIRKRLNKSNMVIKEIPVEKIVKVEVEKEIVVEKSVVVEVVKEVPVEKVVFRDIPVEIIKKEVVHIPVYTNDKELLGKKIPDSDGKK